MRSLSMGMGGSPFSGTSSAFIEEYDLDCTMDRATSWRDYLTLPHIQACNKLDSSSRLHSKADAQAFSDLLPRAFTVALPGSRTGGPGILPGAWACLSAIE